MGELRVALPGVQVLFAFLLVAPFNQRFGKTTHFERGLYFAALLSRCSASILLIAPTVIHRLEFRHGDKGYIVKIGNRLTIAGLDRARGRDDLRDHARDRLPVRHGDGDRDGRVAVFAFTMIWFVVPLWRRRSSTPPAVPERISPQREGPTG